MVKLKKTKPEDAQTTDDSSIEATMLPDPADPAVAEAGSFEIEWEPGLRLATVLKARYGGKLFHSDSFNLARGDVRKKFVKEVARKAKEQLQVAIPADSIEACLMDVADAIDALRRE